MPSAMPAGAQVKYRLDFQGQVHEVWMLTPQEAARKRNESPQPKLYIRTFGCQMNEYDSDKMADVLRAARGLRADRRAPRTPT